MRRSPFGPYVRFVARGQRRPTVFWALGLTIYCGLIVLIYPSVKDAIDIAAIPANLRVAFNINDFTQLANFLSSELFGVILPLLLPFYGLIALSSVVAGAEERGRLDVLLANPIPRFHLVIGSFLVAAVYLLVLCGWIGVVIWTVAWSTDVDLTARVAFRSAFALWPVALFFAALALAVGSVVRQRALAIAIPAAVIFLMYLANVVARLAEAVSGLRYASVFNYYGTAVLTGFDWAGAAILWAATAVLVTFAVIAFQRRNVFA